METYIRSYVANFTALGGLAVFRDTALYSSCRVLACHQFLWDGIHGLPSTDNVTTTSSEVHCRPRYDYICARPAVANESLFAIPVESAVKVVLNAPPFGNYTQFNLTASFPGDFTRFFHVASEENRNAACLRMCRAIEQTIGITYVVCTCEEGSLIVRFQTAIYLWDNDTLTYVLDNIGAVEAANFFVVLEEAYNVGPAPLGAPAFTAPVFYSSFGPTMGAAVPVSDQTGCGSTCIALIVFCLAVGVVLILWVCLVAASCAWGWRVTPKKVRSMTPTWAVQAPPPPTINARGEELRRRRFPQSAYASRPVHKHRQISVKYWADEGEDCQSPFPSPIAKAPTGGPGAETPRVFEYEE